MDMRIIKPASTSVFGRIVFIYTCSSTSVCSTHPVSPAHRLDIYVALFHELILSVVMSSTPVSKTFVPSSIATKCIRQGYGKSASPERSAGQGNRILRPGALAILLYYLQMVR